jgi:hypothetical protein
VQGTPSVFGIATTAPQARSIKIIKTQLVARHHQAANQSPSSKHQVITAEAQSPMSKETNSIETNRCSSNHTIGSSMRATRIKKPKQKSMRCETEIHQSSMSINNTTKQRGAETKEHSVLAPRRQHSTIDSSA